MFYTKITRVIAAIAFFFGISGALIGIGLAMSVSVEVAAGEAGKFSGQFIDYGIYSILVLVVIGMLSEISQSLSRYETNNSR